MPYPNEHAARIRDPEAFDPKSFRNKDLKNGIRIIVANLKGEDGMTIQAYRFSVKQFTPEEAKKWLKDHNVSYIKFESASESEVIHSGVIGMKWGVRKRVVGVTGTVKTHIKNITTPSSDHLQYKALRKKKLKNLTDDEVRTLVKRMKLENSYRKSGEFKTKQIRAMSNVELQTGINRQRLRRAIVTNPKTMKFKEFIKSFRMSDTEAKTLISRISLETDYKNLKLEDYKNTKTIVKELMTANG